MKLPHLLRHLTSGAFIGSGAAEFHSDEYAPMKCKVFIGYTGAGSDIEVVLGRPNAGQVG